MRIKKRSRPTALTNEEEKVVVSRCTLFAKFELLMETGQTRNENDTGTILIVDG